jgi:hypothetical protein
MYRSNITAATFTWRAMFNTNNTQTRTHTTYFTQELHETL